MNIKLSFNEYKVFSYNTKNPSIRCACDSKLYYKYASKEILNENDIILLVIYIYI